MAELQVIKEKANVYSSLVSIIFDKIQKNDYSIENLTLTAKFLKSNPDYYNLWNFRRHILIFLYQPGLGLSNFTPLNHIDSRISADEVSEIELDVAAEGIRRNPKSCK